MTGEAKVEVEKDSEFEDAFNEAATAREGVDRSPAPPDDAGKDTLPKESGTKAGSQEAASAEASAADDAPAGKDKPVGDEEFKGWPQDAIDRYKSQSQQTADLQHTIDSDAGRVSAFQIKVNDLTKQISEITSKGGDQPSKDDIKDAMSTDKKWAAFKEDYPEVSESIEDYVDARFKTQQAEVDTRVGETLAPVIEQQGKNVEIAEADALKKGVAEVAKQYPTWQDAVYKDGSKDYTNEFADWMAIQPPGIHGLGDSDDPKDASTLIGLYDTYRVAQGHPTLKSDPEPDNGVKNKTEADKLSDKRQQQLEDGETLPSKSAGVNANAGESGDEFERAFNVFADRKAAAGARN